MCIVSVVVIVICVNCLLLILVVVSVLLLRWLGCIWIILSSVWMMKFCICCVSWLRFVTWLGVWW